MSFIDAASGICLSPTGGTGECSSSNICTAEQYIQSGKMITIANTCNMPLAITGFYNDNPKKFTIINYPEFSGSGYYHSGNVTGNSVSLPRTLEPGDTWEIMTWWHPSTREVETSGLGSPSKPTGFSQSAKISVLPGDLGFADCANYFTLSGELICDTAAGTLGTGALGTYVQTLFDLPLAPITTTCLKNSKHVYESFRVYPSAADLGNDQTQGLYQLMSWIGGQISGNEDEYPAIRNIAKGFTTGVQQVIDAGNDNDLANLFTFPIPLADSVLYNAVEGPGDPKTGSFKTSTVVPTGSGTLMELGQGYTGINILESRYEDAGAGDAWQNYNNNYGVYVSSGAVDAVNLTARVVIAQSGYQSLRAGTTIENSICTEPTWLGLGAAPAVVGPIEGDFDTLAFARILEPESRLLSATARTSFFNLYIIPDDAALSAFKLDFPLAGAQPLVWKVRKGAVICCVKDSTRKIEFMSASRHPPTLPLGSAKPTIRDPFVAAGDGVTKVDSVTLRWTPDAGPVGDDLIRAPAFFDLNDNGNGFVRYASEWIVNGDIEIADTLGVTVAEADGTNGPGSLADTQFFAINVLANLSTHGYIRVQFLFQPHLGKVGRFHLRGAT